MGQILDAKPILEFDHISQNETERVFLHHLVKSSFIKRRKVRREEETCCGIFSKDLYPPHPEHLLHRRRVFYRSGLDGFNLFGEGTDFLLKRLDLSESFLQFHLKPPIETVVLSPLNCFHIFLMGDTTIDLRIFMGLIFRSILIHDVDIGMNRDLLSDELENGFRRSHFIRHHQMSDQESSLSNPLRIGSQISDLAVHLFENLLDHLGIIRSI
jgi:hypothetical protein